LCCYVYYEGRREKNSDKAKRGERITVIKRREEREEQ
jgi:hypothetical protein